jgi:hypothetical protein
VGKGFDVGKGQSNYGISQLAKVEVKMGDIEVVTVFTTCMGRLCEEKRCLRGGRRKVGVAISVQGQIWKRGLRGDGYVRTRYATLHSRETKGCGFHRFG